MAFISPLVGGRSSTVTQPIVGVTTVAPVIGTTTGPVMTGTPAAATAPVAALRQVRPDIDLGDRELPDLALPDVGHDILTPIEDDTDDVSVPVVVPKKFPTLLVVGGAAAVLALIFVMRK